MRVLTVGSMYPPHHLGGYELVWQGVVRRARENGHKVRVLASDYQRPDAQAPDEPDVHRALRWYWSWSEFRWLALSPWERWRLERQNATELEKHLREFRPDVVAWWPMGGMSLSLVERVRRKGLPSVLSVHDDWLVYGPEVDEWWRLSRHAGRAARALELVSRVPVRIDLARAGRFLFNSDYTRRRAAECGVDPPDADVVTPGVDSRFLAAVPPGPWAWRLYYVGRIERQKGIDTAIAALGLLPSSATLTIVGGGDVAHLDELRRQAAEAGVEGRVHFLGQCPWDQLPSVYARADVVVFPVRWEEPWGLVPLEAMGVGRLVVATGSGGSREFFADGENTLLFAREEPAALAAAVRRLGGDPALRERLRDGGRRTAAAHTAELSERRHVAELELAAASHSARNSPASARRQTAS